MKAGKITDTWRWTTTPEQTVVKENPNGNKIPWDASGVGTQQTEGYGSQHRLCSKRNGLTTNEIKKKKVLINITLYQKEQKQTKKSH